MPLKARDLMNKTAATVPEGMPVVDLVVFLREKRIGGVPVVNEKDKLCGIVTVTDVFNAMKIVKRMRHSKPDWLSSFSAGQDKITVKEIYTRQVISVMPDDPLEKVADLMIELNIHTIPVMNKEQTVLYGVIGRHDVTWAVFGKANPAPK